MNDIHILFRDFYFLGLIMVKYFGLQTLTLFVITQMIGSFAMHNSHRYGKIMMLLLYDGWLLHVIRVIVAIDKRTNHTLSLID